MYASVDPAQLIMASCTPCTFLPLSVSTKWKKHHHKGRRHRKSTTHAASPVARLFGPAIFEASKLKVMFLGIDQEKHPAHLPRTYTLTHSDVTANLTLAISQTINGAQFQGWYNRLYRDEVVAEWKKVKGKMSLHVHCHISGGHVLLDLMAKLRCWIFRKELPVVLQAFVHGDMDLLSAYPELEEASVWIYFHSNLPEYNKVEYWGSLRDAASDDPRPVLKAYCPVERPQQCKRGCSCCFPHGSSIPWAHEFDLRHGNYGLLLQQQCHHHEERQM